MTAFFGSRWRGEIPLAKIFWHDMLLIGSGINVAAALCAIAIFALDGPPIVGGAIFFLPMPYNLFLCVAVWQAAATQHAAWAPAARIGSLVWLAIMTVV